MIPPGAMRASSNLGTKNPSVGIIGSNYHSIRNAKLAPIDLSDTHSNNGTFNPLNENNVKGPISMAQPLIKLLTRNSINKSDNQFAVSKLPPLKGSSLSASLPINPRKSDTNVGLISPPLINDNEILRLSTKSLQIPEAAAPTLSPSDNIKCEEGISILRSRPVLIAQRPATPPPSFTEPEVPSVICLSAGKVFSKIDPFPKLPPLPPPTDPSFDSIFAEKIRICNYIFDFRDISRYTEERDIKSKTLCELVQLFENANQVKQLNLMQQTLFFRMLEKNIFQQTPCVPDVYISANYTMVCVENGWSHLFYCYQLLNRFTQLFPDSPFLTLEDAIRAMDLLSIPDNNERLQLLAFLKIYFDVHTGDRRELLRHSGLKLLDYIEQLVPPYCVGSLLVFSAHAFARNGKNMTKEYMAYLESAVFPLIKSPHFPLFAQHYVQLLSTVFAEGEPVTESFTKYLLRNFYSPDQQIQAFHVDLLISVIPKLPPQVIDENARTFLALIGKMLFSPSIRVVSSALNLWTKPKLDQWIEQDSKRSITNMYDNIKKVSENYWLPSIRERASQCLTEMGKLNRNVFLKLKNNTKGNTDFRVKRYETEKITIKTWSSIIKSLADEEGFDYRAKINEVKEVFDFKSLEAKEKTAISLTYGNHKKQ